MDQNLQIWDQLAGSHESTIPLDFAKHLECIARDAVVVELGCGYGRVLRYLKALGFANSIGIDGAREMLKRAQSVDHRVLIQATVVSLPLKSGIAGGIICIGTLNSLHRSDDRRVCFNEIARVLKPGGRAIIRDFAVTWSTRRMVRYLWYFLRGHDFGNFRSSENIEFHHFRARELRRLSEAAGLHVVGIKEERFITMHGNHSRGLTLVASRGV
ncbi:MAG: class I SAM-dependent methyltransferase [Bryobacterales bacterium]|nr:class I SAM-dependent methyltransferase [Bryobacterales bacterium]